MTGKAAKRVLDIVGYVLIHRLGQLPGDRPPHLVSSAATVDIFSAKKYQIFWLNHLRAEKT